MLVHVALHSFFSQRRSTCDESESEVERLSSLCPVHSPGELFSVWSLELHNPSVITQIELELKEDIVK